MIKRRAVALLIILVIGFQAVAQTSKTMGTHVSKDIIQTKKGSNFDFYNLENKLNNANANEPLVNYDNDASDFNTEGIGADVTIRSSGNQLGYKYIISYSKSGDKFFILTTGLTKIYIDPHIFDKKYLEENEYVISGEIPVVIVLGNIKETKGVAKELRSLGINKIKLNSFLPFAYARVPMELLNTLVKFSNDIKYIYGIYLDYKLQVGLSESVNLIKNNTIWSQIESQYHMKINGSGVVVAVLDTGIDKTHPDLDDLDDNPNTTDPKVILEKSFVDKDGDGTPDEPPTDGFGHGTHVASIIAGTGYASNYTYVGVAPGALLLNGKVLSNGGSGYTSWIVDGITWAVNNSANVINLSLGGYGDRNDPLALAVNWAMDQNVVVVVAAGNSYNYKTINSPGLADKAITVGAIDKSLHMASFSSKGPVEKCIIKPDVVAPGVNIIAARAVNTSMGSPINDYYTSASGTSMATPHVAGVVALLLQVHPEWNSSIIKSVLMTTAKDLGYHPFVQGSGLVNASKAVLSQLAVLPPSISVNENSIFNKTLALEFNTLNIDSKTLNITVSVNFTRFDYYDNYNNPVYLREDDIISMDKNFILEPNDVHLSRIVLNISDYREGYFNGTIILTVNSTTTYRVIFAFYKMSILQVGIFGVNGENLLNPSENIVENFLIYGVYEEGFVNERDFDTLTTNGKDYGEIDVVMGNNYTVFAIGIIVNKEESGYSDYAFYVERNITISAPKVTVNLSVSDGVRKIIKAPGGSEEFIGIDIDFTISYYNGTYKFYKSISFSGYNYFVGDRVFYVSEVNKNVTYSVQFTTIRDKYRTMYFAGVYGEIADISDIIEPKFNATYNILHDTPVELTPSNDGYDVYAYWFWKPPVYLILMAAWIYTHPSEKRVFHFWSTGNWKLTYTYIVKPIEFSGIYAGEPGIIYYTLEDSIPNKNQTFMFGSKTHIPGKFYGSLNSLYMFDIGASSITDSVIGTFKEAFMNVTLLNSSSTVVSSYNGEYRRTLILDNLENGNYTLKINVTYYTELWNTTKMVLKFNYNGSTVLLPGITSINSSNYYDPTEEYRFNVEFNREPLSVQVYWRYSVDWDDWHIATSINTVGNLTKINLGNVTFCDRPIDVKIIAEFNNATLSYEIGRFALSMRKERLGLNIGNVVSYQDSILVEGELSAASCLSAYTLNYSVLNVLIVNQSRLLRIMTDNMGYFNFTLNLTEEYVGGNITIEFQSNPWFAYSGLNKTLSIYIGITPKIIIEQPKGTGYFNDTIFIKGRVIDQDDEVCCVYYKIENVWSNYKLANGTTEWNITIPTIDLDNGLYYVFIEAIDEHGLVNRTYILAVVDKQKPLLEMVYPKNGSLINRSSFFATWNMQDGGGLNASYIKIDNGEWINIGLFSVYPLKNLTEGEHTLYVKVYDRAGNSAFTHVRFTVDTTPPEFQWVSLNNNTLLNTNKLTLSWAASDSVSGLKYYMVKLDNLMWVNVSLTTIYSFNYLTDGEHLVYIKAYDKAGNSNTQTIRFLVDTKAPEIVINSPENNSIIHTSEITISWTAGDTVSGVKKSFIKIDSGYWIDVGTNNSYTFTQLTNGTHTVYVKVIDNAGNENIAKVKFTVIIEENQGQTSQLQYLSILILLIVILAAILLTIRKRG